MILFPFKNSLGGLLGSLGSGGLYYYITEWEAGSSAHFLGNNIVLHNKSLET